MSHQGHEIMFRAFGLGLENESIHVPYAANRFNGTWSLLPISHKGWLFHSRMIRPVVGGGGPTCLKQNLFHSRMIRPVLSETKPASLSMIRPVVGGGGPTCLKQNLFHSRMIRPVVGGGGPTCLKQNLGSPAAASYPVHPCSLMQQTGLTEHSPCYRKVIRNCCFTLE